ncbi:MAG: hypothetical protein HXY36_00950 [Chloroflexi bacterium]|nr:hypothetical protein [Chloroflexota bacterium]
MNKSLRAILILCTVFLLTLAVTPTALGEEASSMYLIVDWAGNVAMKHLDTDGRLTEDLLASSFDGRHSLFLEQGTHAPTVNGETRYVIVVRELEEIPALPENTVAVVAFDIIPAGARFDKDIVLTLSLDESQLPGNAQNVFMAYYDDVSGAWVPLEYETGGPNGVTELTLSAAIDHFSIFGVLVEVTQLPAHFTASGLNIVTSGQTASIAANIVNDGGREGTYILELRLNGEPIDTAMVVLGAGQSQPVSFTVPGLRHGQYEVEVAGLSDEFTVSRPIAWWLVVVIAVAAGFIIWEVVWRKRKTAKEG